MQIKYCEGVWRSIRLFGLPQNRLVGLLGLLCCLCLGAAVPSPAPTSDPLSSFVRFDDDGHGGGKMQVAVGRYVNGDGVRVDLLSTIHIGETSFFRELARQFPKYDAVLYELVAPRGTPPTEEGVNDQQRQIARDCNLENQGPHMNYERSNFVHADLMLEEIQKLEIKQHGTFKGALGDGPGLKEARDETDTAGQQEIYNDIQRAKKSPPAERIRLMRRAYSKLLAFTAACAPGTTYPAGMDVLVGARNDEVLRVLSVRIGKGDKKIAVLYGAAHMVDLEHRLITMGFHRESITWQTAWTVAPDKSASTLPVKSKKTEPQMKRDGQR